MTRCLGLAVALVGGALAGLGCGTATTDHPDVGGTDHPDAGSDATAPADTGVDAPITMDDTGPPDDAGHDAAPRADAGMCVDGPPDPTRPTATTCMACRPPGNGTGGGGGCASDADCNDASMGSNGRCVFGRIGAFCSYDACFADSDCAANEVCLCDAQNGGANTCVPANCHVDADCGAGLACSPTFGTCGHFSGFVAWRCHTATDGCTTDADCAAGYCAFDEVMGHWACSTSECAG